MTLDKKDAKLFFDLYLPLLGFIRKQVGDTPELQRAEDQHQFLFCLREILCQKPNLLEKFISENPEKLNGRGLEIVKSWKNFVHGKFVYIGEKYKHPTFLSIKSGGKERFYEVVGITDPIHDLVVEWLIVSSMLLPWEDKIIVDGLFAGSSTFLGPSFQRDIQRKYREAKKAKKIIKVM